MKLINDVNFIGEIVDVPNADALKKLVSLLKDELKNYVIVCAPILMAKQMLLVMLDDNFVASKNFDAAKIIKEYIAPLIKGGGGGQKTLATAGGQDVSKLNEVIEKVKSLLENDFLGIIDNYTIS